MFSLRRPFLASAPLSARLLSTAVGRDVKPFSEMPSPKGELPILGHLYEMKKKGDVMPSVMLDEFFKELGSIYKLNIPGSPMVFTCDPSAAEQVYRNEGKYPSRGGEDKMQWFYESVLNADPNMAFETGEKWRKLRSMHGKQQAPANVYAYCPGFQAAAKRFVRNVDLHKDPDGYIEDLLQLIVYWAFEASASFSLGADVDIVKGDKASAADANTLREGLELLISSINDFLFDPLFIHKYFPSKIVNDMKKGHEVMMDIASKYSHAYLDKLKKSGNTETAHGQPLLEQWLIEGKMTEENALISTAGMLAAGVDTTALTTAFAIHEISQSSEVQDKLYSQIKSVLGKEGDIDMAALQKLTYLNNVIKETQRLNPVVTAFPRCLDQDIELLGYHIPAGISINYSLYTAGRSENVYKNPLQFDPDRWDRDDIHPFALLPFGHGPRGCWGRRFSEVEMKILITEVVTRFVLESGSEFKHAEKTLIRPGGPVRIRFTPRF